jgi:hypothetical protein
MIRGIFFVFRHNLVDAEVCVIGLIRDCSQTGPIS